MYISVILSLPENQSSMAFTSIFFRLSCLLVKQQIQNIFRRYMVRSAQAGEKRID